MVAGRPIGHGTWWIPRDIDRDVGERQRTVGRKHLAGECGQRAWAVAHLVAARLAPWARGRRRPVEARIADRPARSLRMLTAESHTAAPASHSSLHSVAHIPLEQYGRVRRARHRFAPCQAAVAALFARGHAIVLACDSTGFAPGVASSPPGQRHRHRYGPIEHRRHRRRPVTPSAGRSPAPTPRSWWAHPPCCPASPGRVPAAPPRGPTACLPRRPTAAGSRRDATPHPPRS